MAQNTESRIAVPASVRVPSGQRVDSLAMTLASGTLTPMPPSPHLSKTRFTSGLQCARMLWWRVHEPDAPELAVSLSLQSVFDRGHQVGALAQTRFPDGVLIPGDHRDIAARVERTRLAIASGAPAIFEASFLADNVFAAVDVLERRRGGWKLVEVKSTTRVKDEHIPDVAIQLHVLRAAGLVVSRAEVMHLNPACAFPDLSDLFVRADVTRAAEAFLPGVPAEIRRLRAALVDLLPIVRDHVNHPKFGGSFGLKSVTPALVPELAYGDLEIAEGDVASTLLEGLLLREGEIPAAERKKLRKQLLAYCERDTLATVRVYERLEGLA